MQQTKSIAIIFAFLLSITIAKQIEIDLTNKNAPTDIIKLHYSDTLKVSLKENPSTGFLWSVTNVRTSQDIIEVESEDYVRGKAELDGMLGVPGTKIIVFRAKSLGAETLQLIYSRPWEIQTVLNNDGTINWERVSSEGFIVIQQLLKVEVIADQ